MARAQFLYLILLVSTLPELSRCRINSQWPLTQRTILWEREQRNTANSAFVYGSICPLLKSDSKFGDGSFYYDGGEASVADFGFDVDKDDRKDRYTFTMWLKPDSQTSSGQIFEYKSAIETTNRVTSARGEMVNGKVKFTVARSSGDIGSVTSSVSLDASKFNSVLLSVDDTLRLYVTVNNGPEVYGDLEDWRGDGQSPLQIGGIWRLGEFFESHGPRYVGKINCITFFEDKIGTERENEYGADLCTSIWDQQPGSSCPLFDPSQSATNSAALTTAVTTPVATTTSMDVTTAVTSPIVTTTSMDVPTAVTTPEATTTSMDVTTAITTPVAKTTSMDVTTVVTTPVATTTSMDVTTAITMPVAKTTSMDVTTAITTPVAKTTSKDVTTAITTPIATTTSMDETTAVTTPVATTTSMDVTTGVTTTEVTTTSMDVTTAVTTPEATTTSMDVTTAVTTPVATTTSMDETTAVTTPEATSTSKDVTTAVTTPVATTTSMDVTTPVITPEVTTTRMDLTTAVTTPVATTTRMDVTTAVTTPEVTTTSMDVTTAVTMPAVTTAVTTEPTTVPVESSSTPTTRQTTESSPAAASVPTATLPSSPPQPVYLWPLDDVTGGYDIKAGLPSLTSLATRTCFRTDTPSPDFSQAKSFLLFDGSLDSTVKMEVGSSPRDNEFTVVVFVKPQQPPEGLIWSYSSAQASLGISRIEVSLRYDGSLVMTIWDSGLQAPCGEIVAPEVFNDVSRFSTVIVGRNASALKLQVDHNVWVGNDSCPMSTGNGGQGLMEVGGRGEGESAGYRGHVVCMAVFSQYVSTVDDVQLLSQCGGYDPAPYLGVKACNPTAEIRTERFKLLARNKAPDVTTFPPMTSVQTSSVVKCAGRCLRTQHCKSFAFPSDVTSSCSLFDVVTLMGLADLKGNYYEITSD